MDASKTSDTTLTGFSADVTTAAAPASTSSADSDKDKKLAKKQKKEPGTGGANRKKKPEGKKGTVKVAKARGERKRKERPDEAALLKGISKPATRRLFKQIHNHEKLRLADNATDSIRATIGVTTRRVVHAMVTAVAEVGRQTSYLCDARAAVLKELPRSTVFAQ